MARAIKFILLLLIFCSCYNEKRATREFSRAVVAYPKLPADYCSLHFPCTDSFIHGNPVYQFDTLYIPGDTISVPNNYDLSTWADRITDTVKIHLPSKVIIKTITVTDTIKQTDKAALSSCEIDKSKLTDLLGKKTLESDGWNKKAKTRFYVMWGLVALIVLYTGYKIYTLFKPKVTI